MILADTSIWIEYLRRGNHRFVQALSTTQILVHPSIVAELALGNLNQRDTFLRNLQDLPRTVVAKETEVLHLIETFSLWTRDRCLSAAAADLGVDFRAE